MTKFKRGSKADLGKTAKRVLERSITQSWMPTKKDLKASYGLSSEQVEEVKKKVKRLAKQQQLFWGWWPSGERYRVAPTNDTAVSREMYAYIGVQLRNYVAAASDQVEGAHAQGLLTERGYKRDADLLRTVAEGSKRFSRSVSK